MKHPFIRKLNSFGTLSEADESFVQDIVGHVRHVEDGTVIIREDDRPDNVHLIVKGFACRFKYTDEGRRQIMAYLIPGDFCDLHVLIMKAMDHNIGTLSACEVVDIPQHLISEMTERPALARSLWLATLVDEAILREWLVGIGRRSADQRLGHLICELYYRLRTAGLVEEQVFGFPLSQNELADTVGISQIQANRSFKNLRLAGLIAFNKKTLVILDLPRLQSMSGFKTNYLHLSEGTR